MYNSHFDFAGRCALVAWRAEGVYNFERNQFPSTGDGGQGSIGEVEHSHDAACLWPRRVSFAEEVWYIAIVQILMAVVASVQQLLALVTTMSCSMNAASIQCYSFLCFLAWHDTDVAVDCCKYSAKIAARLFVFEVGVNRTPVHSLICVWCC